MFLDLNADGCKISQLNIDNLTNSFNMLKETTNQVSYEANSIASYLKNKLSETTFRFFSVIDEIEDIVQIKDYDGKWKTLNSAAQKIYGLEQDEYVGKTDEELILLHPELANILNDSSKTDNDTWLSKKTFRSTEMLLNKTKYYDFIKTPVYFGDGSPKELIIIGRDITNIIESERRNKACMLALNSASDNILIINNDMHITFANDSFIQTFGYSSHLDIDNEHISIIYSDITPYNYLNSMWSVLKTNIEWCDIISFRHFDNSIITCKTTIIPVMNGAPEPIFYICTLKVVSNE